jgi:hypothetical protein
LLATITAGMALPAAAAEAVVTVAAAELHSHRYILSAIRQLYYQLFCIIIHISAGARHLLPHTSCPGRLCAVLCCAVLCCAMMVAPGTAAHQPAV